jgi:antitoxin MazE
MKSKVKKWGNSLAVRIPKAYADELKLSSESEIELEVAMNSLKITPKSKKYTLDELLKGMSKENRHEEDDLGGPVGREEW